LGLAERLSAAVLYAAFAAALLALAHRWLLRLSRRAVWALALLPLCLPGPALVTGRTYAPIDLAYTGEPFKPYAAEYGIGGEHRGIFTDLYTAIVPWRQAVRYAVRQGEWPLWNPFILCGDPLAGSAQPAPYHPINALSLLLPLALAFTFGAAAQLFAAMLTAFLYLRDLGCREVAALLGAVGWALSSFAVFWLEWPLGAAVSLVPLVALGARRVARQPGWPAALLLAAALTLTVLAGHPESAAHVAAVGAVLGLAQTAAAPPRRWGAVAGWAAAAGGLALALSAVYLLPLLEALRQTLQWVLRQAAPTLAAAAPAAEAWRHLLASWVPSMAEEARGGAGAAARSAAPVLLPPRLSGYAGSVLWGPALYGLLRGPGRGRFLLAAVGAVGLCCGARMPWVYPLVGRLPLLSIAINERLVFAGAFATAALAALGVEAWLRQRDGRGADEADPGLALRPDSLGFAGACCAAALVFAGAAAWLVPLAAGAGFTDADLGRWARWSLVPLFAAALVAALAAWLEDGRGRAVASGASAAAARARRAGGWAAAALVAVLVVQRAGEMGSLYPTLPARAFYPRVAPLGALPRGSEEPWRAVGQDFQLIPNQGALYEIEDVRGYQAIFHRRFADLVPLWAQHVPSWYLAVHDLARPYLSLVNVRYAIVHRRREAPGWRVVARGPSSWLLENPRALPRAFVPRRVRLGVPPDQEVEEMAQETEFGRLAWIAPPAGDRGPPREERNGRGWVVATRRGLGFELTARMKQPGWAVITETAWAGWRARLDGREVPLGIGDHAFLALAIPEGWHEAELFYRPRSFELGLALSLAALVLIAAVSFARTRAAAPAAEPAVRRVGDRIAIAGDYQYRALHAGPAVQRFWHRAKLEEALALLRPAPGDRVLDAGCGSGLLAAMAAETPGTAVLGVDANPAAIEFASRTYARPNLAFRQALLDELDAAPGSFDKIACLEVIEHLARGQGDALLARFAELLAPGGRLVLTTPNRRSPWPLLEWLLDRLRLAPRMAGEQHEVLYDLDELRAAGEAAGLSLAEHRMVDTLAPWIAWWPGLAHRVHRAELRLIRRHGCVMVLAFDKPPATEPAPGGASGGGPRS
jgi:SAM-dependent methyltransferase